MMILVPVLSSAAVAFLCLGLVVSAIEGQSGLGLDEEGFFVVGRGVAEIVDDVVAGKSPDTSSLEEILDTFSMRVEVFRDGEHVYGYGMAEEGDEDIVRAALTLGGRSSALASGPRRAFASEESIGGEAYTVVMLGSDEGGMPVGLRVAAALAALAVVVTIILSVSLTNKVLTKRVLRRIEEPVELLSEGAEELGSGNLDHRIQYDYEDEFKPVCKAFNEMAARLKDYIELTKRNEEARKELVAGLSHDIRSPLTSIQAYVEGLLDGVAGTPEKQKGYLLTVKRKAGEIDRMLSQMLAFSKLEMEACAVNLRSVDLLSFMESLVEDISEEYRDEGLEMRFKPGTEACLLQIDPELMRRVVRNILDNSVKYRTGDKCEVEISLRKEGSSCVLSFTDDGPGVPPGALDKLFDVFYRADESRRNPASGSGLGLSIVAKSIERMGGSVRAENASPRGLSVVITFNGGKR